MGLSIEAMREQVAKAYHSDEWARKVKKMQPNQILAVYNRLREAKKI